MADSFWMYDEGVQKSRFTMENASSRLSVLRFASYELDAQRGELRKAGLRVKLQPQPLRVLILLASRASEVVTREEIQEEIWGDDIHVDFDQGLNFCIRQIRAALRDDADKPRYIETLARTGYRFLAPVTGQEPVPTEPKSALLDNSRLSHKTLRWIGPQTALILLLLALVGAAFVVTLRFRGLWTSLYMNAPAAVMTTTPFTAYGGREMYPAFSPDGSQIAFSWNGEAEDNYDIYVKLIGEGGPLRLTTHPASDLYPVWSPDGRYIAFCRLAANPRDDPPGHLDSLMTVYTVPALGGAERKITECRGNRNALPSKYLDWSPDGKFLVIVDKDKEAEPFGLFLLSVDTRERKRLTLAPSNTMGDTSPAFSPDGRTVAFTRIPIEGAYQTYVIPITGGKPRPLLVAGFGHMREPFWMPDGQAIVFYGNRRGAARLWRVPAKGGEPEALPITGEYSVHAVVSRRGNRLAYQSTTDNANIWRIDATFGNRGRHPPVKLISSTRLQASAKYSPDGKRIVFVSNRSGPHQIWIADSEGQNPTQLTHFDNLSYAGAPHWSPDGTRIAFSRRIDENYDVYVISVEGGAPIRLTHELSRDVNPSWSRDAHWIYFCSDRSGINQIWKLPAEGGDAIQVTKNGGVDVQESADGEKLYYSKGENAPGLWSVPTRGGEESLVYRPVHRYWDLVNDGVYFVEEIQKKYFIQFLNFRTGAKVPISQIGIPWFSHAGLSVSPDRRWILYEQRDGSNSNIMVVENFR